MELPFFAPKLPVLYGLCAILLTFMLTITLLLTPSKYKRMPPGPKPVPFIGNAHQIPSVKPWRKFEEWNKQYGMANFDQAYQSGHQPPNTGPVISLWLGRTPVIGKSLVLGSIVELIS